MVLYILISDINMATAKVLVVAFLITLGPPDCSYPKPKQEILFISGTLLARSDNLR
jgi:hypothetical protein